MGLHAHATAGRAPEPCACADMDVHDWVSHNDFQVTGVLLQIRSQIASDVAKTAV